MNIGQRNRPLVFDIARGSFVDGPGIRTVVFLKGCPLRCRWCQNPEGMDPEPEASLGVYYSPRELSAIIARDLAYYQTSGGGATFSGGEPLMFCHYLTETSKYLKRRDIHITIETSGFFDWDLFSRTMKPCTDMLLYDLKIFDSSQHLIHTGQTNHKILENFRNILKANIPLEARIPLIPGITATEENLEQWAFFLKKYGIENYRLIPYNPSGIEKWRRLGKHPPAGIPENPLTLEEERRWNKFFRSK